MAGAAIETQTGVDNGGIALPPAETAFAGGAGDDSRYVAQGIEGAEDHLRKQALARQQDGVSIGASALMYVGQDVRMRTTNVHNLSRMTLARMGGYVSPRHEIPTFIQN